jgi:hypothetical protein
MKEFGTGPEDYCYYGAEGNPVFTDRSARLLDMDAPILDRLQHMHFFTTSVGAGEDGMTKFLYLDTINKAELL